MSEQKRSGGRPSLAPGQPTDIVHVPMPAYLHDAACQIALHEGIAVVAVIRRAVSYYASCNSLTAPSFLTRNPSDR